MAIATPNTFSGINLHKAKRFVAMHGACRAHFSTGWSIAVIAGERDGIGSARRLMVTTLRALGLTDHVVDGLAIRETDIQTMVVTAGEHAGLTSSAARAVEIESHRLHCVFPFRASSVYFRIAKRWAP
ncbi:hypothetical protein [Adlercreutzia equolifaciens]|uniref:hypothetical protein n=1 Tax=Adlercreutzia equolifaciens TaxID=446660 RepID=UPI0031B597DD